MDTKLCRMLGIEFPLVAFSHCRDVVAAVSRVRRLRRVRGGGLHAGAA